MSDFAAGDEDVLLLTSYEGIGSLEVGALQRLARAGSSCRCARASTSRPARRSGSAPRSSVAPRAASRLPCATRVDGFLAPDAERLAERLVELVRDPGLAAEMGRAGRERVRERFLVTAALERELRRSRAAGRAGAR